MRILVADADPVLQAQIAATLEADGFSVLAALDGPSALAAFRSDPDLVITAADLPGISGLDLARLIKLSSRQRPVPVLMLTGAGPGVHLLRSLEAGVLEFLAKPFAPEELRLRVQAIARLTRLQRELLASRERSDEELRLVKHVLARLQSEGEAVETPGFHGESRETRRINGDAWLHREGLPGLHYGMICDATGHGLMAGVSTIPVLETFLSMAGKDLPLDRIYQEIHAKLQAILPTGRFACLLLMRLDVVQGVLSVLNAGMPEVLLLRTSGDLQRFPSRVLPAGVRGPVEAVCVTEACAAPGDRILAFSDGLGELVAPAVLEAEYLRGPAGASHPEHCRQIRELVRRDLGQQPEPDDVTWSLWEVPHPDAIRRLGESQATPAAAADLEPSFEASFSFDPRRHPPRALAPELLGLLRGFQISHAKAQLLGMLVGEALSNALEHGLLGLDSRLKRQGFEAYEQQLRQAQADLRGGSIRFTLTLYVAKAAPSPEIRRVRVLVADSGPGFDWRGWLGPAEDAPDRPFGRGIALLAALGRELAFNEAGNEVSFHLDCP
jgi:CheY-like chemotaxis protein